MKARKTLANKLLAEIAMALPLNSKFAWDRALEAKGRTMNNCSTFDQYIFKEIRKASIIPNNYCDSEHSTNNLIMSHDQLAIRMQSVDRIETGTVRSKHPIPQHVQHGIFYFEVLLKSGHYLSIGLSTDRRILPKIVGNRCGCSCSYFCFRGKFNVIGRHYDYGPRFGLRDLIGCGLHLASRQLFFMHNGKFLGPATILPELDDNTPDLLPTVSIIKPAILEANFGQKPFKHLDTLTMNEDVPKRWQNWQ